jgi:hypothetical protein
VHPIPFKATNRSPDTSNIRIFRNKFFISPDISSRLQQQTTQVISSCSLINMCIHLRPVFLSGLHGTDSCTDKCFDEQYRDEYFQCAAPQSAGCIHDFNNNVRHIRIPIACWAHINNWVAGARNRWNQAWVSHQEVDPWFNTMRTKSNILDPSLAQVGGYLARRLHKLRQDHTSIVS